MNKDDWNNPYRETTPYVSPSNPYAVPESEIVVPEQTEGARIEGKCLVVPKDWQSPPICLLTGDTTDLSALRRKKLTWIHPAWFILFFIIRLVALLVFILLRKKGEIHYCISQPLAAKLKRRRTINWCIFGTGLLTAVLPMAGTGFDIILQFVLTGFILIVLSGVLATTWCRPFYARKIDKTHIWIAKIPARVREAIVGMERTAVARPWM
ncbi:MAG: hypothetical protein JWM59_4798 [Verrucomicrobiales bacterium]|nr:hypothetical protein [Verrucomicrobiales bacterium]